MGSGESSVKVLLLQKERLNEQCDVGVYCNPDKEALANEPDYHPSWIQMSLPLDAYLHSFLLFLPRQC